ncbi:MAG: DUF3800 domain-containing protein [Nitrospirae bacterium]|nr:DUF3800 domain-containing protein [Nitrospirota bacterium]MBF0540463.1 DUF3800 domain-containing protein [Nitrospirota bacterium]
MLYLYIDESGDLGFDFFAKNPSNYFTITVLTVQGVENNRRLINAVKKTLKRKLPKRQVEMKGAKDSIRVKEYFYKQVSDIPFDIYSVTLNKRRVYDSLTKQKDRVYNFITRTVLDEIPFENALLRIQVIIDKSKSKKEIVEFNDYIIRHIKGRIDPIVPLEIYHYTSHENFGLQAVDAFSWGIFRKYEKHDYEWFNIFKRKIRYDTIYLPEK